VTVKVKGKAMLFDSEKCIACRACEIACLEWNNLPGDDTSFSPTYTNPQYVTSRTWTTIVFHELGGGPGKPPLWVFTKIQCFHCIHPTCAEVCPTKALHKDPETGAVVWDADKCIGCRYCEVACPFGIVKYNAEAHTIDKCTFCNDRIKNGIPPACAQACPTGALFFGDYDEVASKARSIEGEGRYVYGLREAGGTRFMIALPKGVKPRDAGLPSASTRKPAYAVSNTGSEDYRGYAERVIGEWLAVGVVGGLALAGLKEARKRGGGEKQQQ
jgi:formate dehydrogenase iron-sulfur subunit